MPEAEPTFQLSVTKPEEQQSGSVVTAKARGPMRPVPGVPGVAWERTEYGTSLVMNPDPEFDNLPDEVRSDIIRRLMKCFAAPQHYLRVTALRDEFSTDPAKRQSDERPSAETDFQYGPELPDIDAVEFSFVFDYSDDDSRYFVLYGKKVLLGGPAANDPEDCITDFALGNGRYTVRLGSTLSQGLPIDLFASGEARWLGVQVTGHRPGGAAARSTGSCALRPQGGRRTDDWRLATLSLRAGRVVGE